MQQNNELGLPAGIVVLHPYTDDWPDLFSAEEARLRAAIGPFVLDIQHVGSTSIPGMPAKPIIDIAIAVRNFEEAAVNIPALADLGYRYRGENGIPRRHFFIRGEPRTHHIHMVEPDSADWRQLLLFRDRLRADTTLAQDYAALKQKLAGEFSEDRIKYLQGKAAWIGKVLRAED